MMTQMQLREYLQEIRDEVCSRCVERPPGGPPCTPLGKICGVELHLENLIDSIHEVRSNRMGPYLDHNRQEVCEKCAFLHSDVCPCPMDSLALLVVEAVETVDVRLRLRGETARLVPTAEKVTLNDLRQAFRESAGTWTGCDWPTTFGKSKLDLEGLMATQAAAMAATSDDSQEVEDWIAASNWLARIEHHAQLAQKRAAAALQAAKEGRWRDALDNAELAWSLEFTTGRPLRRGPPLAWQRFRDRVEAAAPMAVCETASTLGLAAQ
jgi:hypothetical protein